MNEKKLITRFISWFFLFNTLIFWIIGSSYLFVILSSASLFKNSIAIFDSNFGTFFVGIFTIINYLSYMMLLALIPALIVILVAKFFPNKKAIFLLSILFSSLSIILLIIDTRIFTLFRFHLNKTIISFIVSPYWKSFFDFSLSEFIGAIVIILLIFIIEILLAVCIWRKIVIQQKLQFEGTIFISWLGGFVLSVFTLLLSIGNNNNLLSQQIPNLPLYTQILAAALPYKNAKDILLRYSEHHFSQPLFPTTKLHYPLEPLLCQQPKNPLNIILITVDSLRYDMLTAEYMPNLKNFSSKTWNFLNHYSGGNSTQPGIFSLFYSIPSNYWTAVLNAEKPPILVTLLLANNYLPKIIWTADIEEPPFHKTVYKGVANTQVTGNIGNDVGAWDREATKKTIAFLDAKHTQPFFLHVFYNAPHAFCSYQSFPEIFKPSVKYCSRMLLNNFVNPKIYFNRYLNAVHFVDTEIEKILLKIKDRGYLNNSIIVVTSDHGQEFNENHNNYWGHTSNFTDFQVKVPFLIYWPGEKANTFTHRTSHYDLVPTILSRHFKCKNDFKSYSIGQDLLNITNRWPFILVGSYIHMGIIEPDRLTTLQTSGDVFITDLKSNQIANAKPRNEIINEALVLMRKYF